MKINSINVFKKVSTSLTEAVTILDQRIKDIEQATLSQSLLDESNVLKVFYIRSLNVYKETIIYLSDQIQKENMDFDSYTLPVTRKLFDIYVRFIHLQEKCESDNKRALTCIAYQLQSYSFMNNKQLYEDLLILYKPVLQAGNCSFPSFNEYDYMWYLRTSGLAFKTTHELFKEDTIAKYFDRSGKGFKGVNLISIYGGISEISHGNPFYMSTNERFWVITSSLMITSFIFEIIDNFILHKPQRKDYRLWKSNLRNLNEEVLAIWPRK